MKKYKGDLTLLSESDIHILAYNGNTEILKFVRDKNIQGLDFQKSFPKMLNFALVGNKPETCAYLMDTCFTPSASLEVLEGLRGAILACSIETLTFLIEDNRFQQFDIFNDTVLANILLRDNAVSDFFLEQSGAYRLTTTALDLAIKNSSIETPRLERYRALADAEMFLQKILKTFPPASRKFIAALQRAFIHDDTDLKRVVDLKLHHELSLPNLEVLVGCRLDGEPIQAKASKRI